MDNKIALVYLNGEYTVNINGTLMHKGNDAEEMFEKFQNVIKNNSIRETTSWEYIKDRINELNLREAKINEDYKTIEFQSIKYFHNINKLYNIAGDSMVELAGAYNLLYFILEMNKAGYLRDSQDLVDICMVAMDNKANYRYYDTNFIITSAMFNYGVAEYNFATGKIHRGVSIEKGTFEEFKKYVFGVFSK
ncbi:hypothetical protein [Clostridium sp. CAG:265]|uniref:hypothetical protein n=1 Tax=Clostridium sp. CAG:265 TaxID=1262787 RepID=UPI00033BA84B|nr:hypothetical protein [Clostridium sp. CAG:265]CDB74622.1 putative uncharacterized protein [Clostridium sp. CAG:265]